MGEYDPAAVRERVLRGIRRELQRHPAVEDVTAPPAETQVVARLAPDRLGVDTDMEPTLTVRWYPGDTPEREPAFSFHFSAGPADCGWHYEPNPHVDGRAHYQERPAPEADYEYEPYTFGSLQPTRVVWEVLDRLGERLERGWP
jgi:hypothetical protein